jgi:outer membrane cobalamin receptor
VATGFKLPSLYALGYPLIANPTLKPERARSLEAGLEGCGATRWRAAVFEHRYRDLIDFDPVLFTNVNRAQVATRGVQTRIEREFAARWLARGTLGWLDIDSATPLRARPRWQGAAEVVWQTRPSLESSLALSFNDEYKDSAIPTGLIRAPGHALLDAGLRWQANSTLALAFSLRNALAAEYEDAVGFPAPGRTLWLSVQLRI